jgi:hypothetical protein
MYYPDDYHSVKGRWITENKVRKVRIWKDGERRRNKLFAIARKIVLIKPGISMEGLMFNLLFQRHHFFNNDDHVLSFDCLLSLAQDALRAKGVPMINDRHPVRRINKDYCQEYGKKWQSVMWDIRNEARDNALCELYDPNLTLKRNVERMEELGFKISERTLSRWLKKNMSGSERTIALIYREPNNIIDTVRSSATIEPHEQQKRNALQRAPLQQPKMIRKKVIPLRCCRSSSRLSRAIRP